MLEAMRRENEQLRNRLVDTEREFIRISRLNEIYREELIQHRRRVRIYIYLPPTSLPPPECKRKCKTSGLRAVRAPRGQPDRIIGARPVTSSPRTGAPLPTPRHPRPQSRPRSQAALAAAPIPCALRRAWPSRARPRRYNRPPPNATSESTTPLSHSPSSASDSPYLSPLALAFHAPSELRNGRDHAPLVLRAAPRRSADHCTPAALVPVRSAPVALVVVRGPGLARRASRESVASWVAA